MNLTELDRFITLFPSVRKMIVTQEFYDSLSLTLCSMQRFGANGPATPGSLVAGPIFYRDCEIMTENKNEWETIEKYDSDLQLVQNTCIRGSVIQGNCEYRLQRRKKEKVMPEMPCPSRNDGIVVKTGKIWVLTGDWQNDCSPGANATGDRTTVFAEEVIEIWRCGKQIWRREG